MALRRLFSASLWFVLFWTSDSGVRVDFDFLFEPGSGGVAESLSGVPDSIVDPGDGCLVALAIFMFGNLYEVDGDQRPKRTKDRVR